MGLKDRNNPLGQRTPSDKVGEEKDSKLKHGQSSELVEEIRKKAKQESQSPEPPKKSPGGKPSESNEYDTEGPDRQPGKIMRQSRLGKEPRKPQEGQYTQDNEEEPDKV